MQAAIAAAAACTTVAELQAAAIAFDACDHVRTNPARPGGPGPRCTAERPVMFVGKTPAATESGTGIPFSGPAGQMLRRMLDDVGMDLDAAWLTCASWWRARKDNTPNATQLAYSRPFLHAEVRLVRPSAIVLLGEKAIDGLLGETGPVTDKFGTRTTFDADGESIPVLRAMCHAFAMYQPLTRGPVFQKHILDMEADHPQAFSTMRIPAALAA